MEKEEALSLSSNNKCVESEEDPAKKRAYSSKRPAT